METIAIVNPKGGTGKSLTAYAICRILAERGHKVLAVDADREGVLSDMAGIDEDKQRESVLDFLYEKTDTAIASLQMSRLGFPVASCDVLIYEKYLRNEADGRTALKKVLARFENHFDYCIIDAPPCANEWIANILMAAQNLIVPENVGLCRIGFFGLLKDLIDTIKNNGNPELDLHGFLFTLDDKHPEKVPRLQEAAERLNTKVFQARVRYDESLDNLYSHEIGEYAFSPASDVGTDYRAFVNELFPLV